MCFRPAEVQMKKCPSCGKANPPIAKVCADCGASLVEGTASSEMNPPMPGAPAAPSAPIAPGAPTAPSAPSAPQK